MIENVKKLKKKLFLILITSLLLIPSIAIGHKNITVVSALAMVAMRTPLTLSEVTQIAYLESSGNPKAVSSSGAKGLFQFMPRTWASLNKRYKLHFSKKPSFDLYEQTMMMICLTNENYRGLKRRLKANKKDDTISYIDIYIMHNVGINNAYNIKTLKPNERVNKYVPIPVLVANYNLYWCDTRWCTKKESYEKIKKKLELQ